MAPMNGVVMNKEEAKHIVQAELESYRAKPYSELVQMIDSPLCSCRFQRWIMFMFSVEPSCFQSHHPCGIRRDGVRSHGDFLRICLLFALNL